MARKIEPRMVTMREFRSTFAQLTEPVRVVRARGTLEVVGTWMPAKVIAPDAEKTLLSATSD